MNKIAITVLSAGLWITTPAVAFAGDAPRVVPITTAAPPSRNTVIDGRQSHTEQLRHQNVIINEFHALHLSTAQWAQIQADEKAFHETPRGHEPNHDEIMLHNKRMMLVLTPEQRRQFSADMAKRWRENAASKPAVGKASASF